MRIGCLGGTGVEGKGIALRFAAAGVDVVIGSRSYERAAAKAGEYGAILGASRIKGMENREMLASCHIVFLTVPFDQAISALESCRSDFVPGTVLVDVTVPAVFAAGRVEYFDQAGGSNAETIARHLPSGVELVGAFKTIPAHLLAELDEELRCSLFVCGDSREAREEVIQLAHLIPTLLPLDAGSLYAARAIERMTILAIQLNRRYKSRAARFHVIGI